MELGERTGHDLGTSLRRSTRRGGGGRRGGLGLFGPFGAKERSARVTERSVRSLRVREGVGGNRSRVREACGCHRGTGGAGSGRRTERPSGREAERPRGREARGRGDFGEINPSLGSRIPILGKLELFEPNLENYF